MENDSEIDANVAFGQAFGATMLLTFLLKSLVHKKVFSEQEVTHLIHHTLLAEEVNGKQIVPEAARVRTQGMLEANVLPFSAAHLAGFDLRRTKNNQIPLLPLPPKGHYRLPSLLRDEGAAVQTDTGPILLHLRLESGLLLDLPLSQETIDGLILTLGHMTTLK